MTGRWNELDDAGRALVEEAFVALETNAAIGAAIGTAAGSQTAIDTGPSPSALWGHATGSALIPRAELAAALLRRPDLRATLSGMLERAAAASGPRVAAAASNGTVSERGGDGFHLRLLPARGAPDQTWIMIVLEPMLPVPTRLTVLPSDGPPETTALEAPVDGTVQVLAPTGSDLVRALADPTAHVFLL